ncbi:LysR family transcriptional regulator [Loktanella sp. IMCC34160]|uniref:LysR family transcriptional regulator n=1 Tax=Loktanella sp. IMCC34160 TaxID=2510646 RepID=UPI00101BCBDF|nr:LysR family transcriptional regulator [Loktanella sp. IMCC34160]RYG92100.1 LysR family transcriptional regulator [Loktanella sp. IMCC34160]
MHRSNWDDLRFVLAVAETGSVSAAARALGVNHATVLRRIAGFEERVGAPVFDRTAQGYRVPADKLRVIEAAREVQNAIMNVDRLLRGADAQLSGVVRITSTDTFCTTVLPPIVHDLMAEAPGLAIELHCTNAHLDLSRLHADISVRPALKLADDLVGDPAGQMGLAPYTAAGADTQKWLGLTGALSRSRAADWMAANVGPEDITSGADSFMVLCEMVAAGLGRGFLPCVLGEGDRRLRRLPEEIAPVQVVPLWVASHIDLAQAPRLRGVRARLAEALAAESDWMLGQGPRRPR